MAKADCSNEVCILVSGGCSYKQEKKNTQKQWNVVEERTGTVVFKFD